MTEQTKTEKKPVVRLVGQNGNAFMIIGLCRRAAKAAKWTPERIDAVMTDMMSGNYDHVLQVALREFDVR